MIQVDEIEVLAADMEPLPASASRLANLLSGPGWDLDDVVEVLRLDQALMARILRTVNSSASGSRETITDLDTAVMRIGPGSVLSLAIGVAARDQMCSALDCFDLTEGQLWRHSVAAALAVDLARGYCRTKVPNEAYASALLHDIGKLVLARVMRPAILHVMKRHVSQGSTSTEAEVSAMRMHHGEVGQLVARNWGLPEPIVVGIAYHHSPESAPTERARTLARFVALADLVATEIGAPDGEDLPFEPELLESVGLDIGVFTQLCGDVEDRLQEVLARYE